MKALVITNLFPSPQEPTRGVFNLNRFGALSKYCELRVVSPLPWWSRWRSPRTLVSMPTANYDRISCCYPAYWSVPRLYAMHSDGIYRSLKPLLRRIRREFPFDVIISAWAYPDAVAGAKFANDFNCPHVIKVMGSDINEIALHPALHGKILSACQTSSKIIAVSNALGDKIERMGIPKERIVRQHNAVDGERFRIQNKDDLRNKLKLPLDKHIVCYVGNFKPEKGTDILVEAWGEFQKSDKGETILVLVGGGSLEPKLHAIAKENGVGDSILFAGRRPHAEIPDWMGACDIFCLPSLRDGCPNVVLEALASGRPVVASRVGGIPELLNDDNGIMAEPNNPSVLSQALSNALNKAWNPETLRGSVECLSWDVIGRRVYALLEEVLSEPRTK